MDRENARDSGPTWGEVGSMFLGLPELRGYWPLGHRNAAGQSYDQSGQGRVLSQVGTPTAGYFNNVAPYHIFDGASQYLQRADENDLDITGAMTIGGWFRFGRLAALEWLFGKGSNLNLSYYLSKSAANNISFIITATGGAPFTIAQHTITVAASTWYFIVGRYVPSTALDILVNNVLVTNAVAIPAAAFSGSGTLTIGAYVTGPIQYMLGNAACCFLCSTNLPDVTLTRLFSISRVFFGV
jgi:hypothetical protein